MRIQKMEETDTFTVSGDWTKARTIRNLLLVSFSFLLLFSAFQALSNLQSSINCDAGLGLASLSTIYVTLIVSSTFVPSFMISHLGLKWTMAASMVGYIAYTAANFYPSWGTLIPTSALTGMAAAPLWTAKATYIATLGARYAHIEHSISQDVINRFFGIFFLFFQTSQIIGNLISSLVLKSRDSPIEDTNNTNEGTYTCGAHDCYSETGKDAATSYCNPPSESLTNILVSVYLVCGILAATIMSLCVQTLPRNVNVKNGKDEDSCALFGATMRMMKEPKLVLLIPLTVYSGLQGGFLSGDFTKSYVTCTIGVSWVGYVVMCYGAASAISSFVWGALAKYTGRLFIFVIGASTSLLLIIVLLSWTPRKEQLWVMFVISSLFGITGAVWNTQLNALYGTLFPGRQEAAFSNFRLWNSVGFAAAFAYSNFICVWTKVTILFVFLGIGFSGCFIIERQYALTIQKRQNMQIEDTKF